MRYFKITLWIVVTGILFSCGSSNALYKEGNISFYADKFDGRKTASGEIFSNRKLTAAHRTLPFGTKVEITNIANGKSVTVKINDRGPFVDSRIFDLSKAAFEKIADPKLGVIKVRYVILD